jgi:serine/threonine-protein kinase
MFLREARVAALLEHANVVRAYDYGEADGELYLAMEYVEGQPLSRVLRALADARERLPAGLAAYVLAEACEGLHAAHELEEAGEPLNLVHRDVSPQNVMIGYDGRVRLLDFGVAKIESENVTKTGEVKGKSAYMSPEQAMGEPVDRRSDLFGVGAILFECLALKRMWGDGTDMEVIRKLALEEPPPLEKADKDAPTELRDLYTRLVAREAKARPASAREAADGLRKAAKGGPEDLRALLEKHFGDHAREQKEKLTRALHDVAPEKAEELRESVSPVSEGRRPAVTVEERKEKSRIPLFVGGALIVVLGLAAWRLSAQPVREPERVRANVSPTTVSSAPPAASQPTPPPSVSASASSSSEIPSPPPNAGARPPPPTIRPPSTSTSTSTTTSTSAKPAASRPLDVDPTPF